uniref:Uncharacterized protein n=1 Tax=Oryza glumipatula TaxID=40148 RepID=A0A0D9YP69_9ORYZ
MTAERRGVARLQCGSRRRVGGSGVRLRRVVPVRLRAGDCGVRQRLRAGSATGAMSEVSSNAQIPSLATRGQYGPEKKSDRQITYRSTCCMDRFICEPY